MSWHVPLKEHKRISETRVFLSLDRVSGTLYLSHYITEISHLYSLRDFWRHFGLSRAVAHSDCGFFTLCTNILTYLLISERPWKSSGIGFQDKWESCISDYIWIRAKKSNNINLWSSFISICNGDLLMFVYVMNTGVISKLVTFWIIL